MRIGSGHFFGGFPRGSDAMSSFHGLQRCGQRMLRTAQRSRRAALLAGAVGLVLAANRVQASAFSWDPALSNGGSAGGGGTWDATVANWFNGVGDVAWPNTNPNSDAAMFSGSSGTVTVGTTINLNALALQS